MSYLPRGIDPELLVSQVKNTMPYLFEPEAAETPLGQMVPSDLVRNYSSDQTLSHLDYFKLCLSSHFLTCGTPVPTDVDNQIRRKLWSSQVPLDVALQMADFVLQSRTWKLTLLSSRFTYGAKGSPWENETVSGHLGEWFTVSCAAYCALTQYSDPLAQAKRQEIFEQIADEVRRHSEIFGSLWNANEGVESLKTAANIAHNFGDLDRVMDMWDLNFADPLRLQFYKLTASPFDSDRKLRYLGRLWVAGELYKSTIDGSSMALENHRHFALRKPRSLRKFSELVIPTGPFFDGWGKRVAKKLSDGSGAPTEETREVVEALIHGWERLPKTVGYGRALRGIFEVHPKLSTEFSEVNLFKTHHCRAVLDMPQDRFEKKWNDEALKLMDEIPSRAE